MNMEDKLNLCRRAISEYGVGHQLNKAEEELTELLLALMHYRDSKDTLEHVCEEIADVGIMLLQLRLMLGSELMDKAEVSKYGRLKKLLEEKDNGSPRG